MYWILRELRFLTAVLRTSLQVMSGTKWLPSRIITQRAPAAAALAIAMFRACHQREGAGSRGEGGPERMLDGHALRE